LSGGGGGGGMTGLNPALTQQGLANRHATGGVGMPAGGLSGYSGNLAALQVPCLISCSLC
jgi:hypothetical protein